MSPLAHMSSLHYSCRETARKAFFTRQTLSGQNFCPGADTGVLWTQGQRWSVAESGVPTCGSSQARGWVTNLHYCCAHMRNLSCTLYHTPSRIPPLAVRRIQATAQKCQGVLWVLPGWYVHRGSQGFAGPGLPSAGVTRDQTHSKQEEPQFALTKPPFLNLTRQ